MCCVFVLFCFVVLFCLVIWWLVCIGCFCWGCLMCLVCWLRYYGLFYWFDVALCLCCWGGFGVFDWFGVKLVWVWLGEWFGVDFCLGGFWVWFGSLFGGVLLDWCLSVASNVVLVITLLGWDGVGWVGWLVVCLGLGLRWFL